MGRLLDCKRIYRRVKQGSIVEQCKLCRLMQAPLTSMASKCVEATAAHKADLQQGHAGELVGACPPQGEVKHFSTSAHRSHAKGCGTPRKHSYVVLLADIINDKVASEWGRCTWKDGGVTGADSSGLLQSAAPGCGEAAYPFTPIHPP